MTKPYNRRPVADPEILTMYQSCRHLSQMHTTNYMPFTRETAVYWHKFGANRGGGLWICHLYRLKKTLKIAMP